VPACCRRRGEVQDHLRLHQFSARRRRRTCRFQLFSSNSNVTLTRQTCGKRSGMGTGSKQTLDTLSASILFFHTNLLYVPGIEM